MDQSCLASEYRTTHQASIAAGQIDEPAHTLAAPQAAGSRPEIYPRTLDVWLPAVGRIRIADIVGDDLWVSRFLMVGLS
jgi:hypothetical protein